MFRVPSRPRGTAYHLDGTYLMRSGQALVPMSEVQLRHRFGLAESKSAIVSQVISAAIDAELVKPDEKVGTSRKFARYLPFWA